MSTWLDGNKGTRHVICCWNALIDLVVLKSERTEMAGRDVFFPALRQGAEPGPAVTDGSRGIQTGTDTAC